LDDRENALISTGKYMNSDTLDTKKDRNVSNSDSEHKVFRVAIVEDQSVVRESWQQLISALPEFVCLCSYSSGEAALKDLPMQQIDVVLMDIRLPGLSGIECTSRLKMIRKDILIIMLTDYDEDDILFSALEAGADGYLLKRSTPKMLRSALLDVVSGGAPMTSEIARHVIHSFRRKSFPDLSLALTPREEEVLSFLTRGYSNKEIAQELRIKVETVRSHLKHIYEKMHVSSRGEAVAKHLGL